MKKIKCGFCFMLIFLLLLGSAPVGALGADNAGNNIAVGEKESSISVAEKVIVYNLTYNCENGTSKLSNNGKISQMKFNNNMELSISGTGVINNLSIYGNESIIKGGKIDKISILNPGKVKLIGVDSPIISLYQSADVTMENSTLAKVKTGKIVVGIGKELSFKGGSIQQITLEENAIANILEGDIEEIVVAETGVVNIYGGSIKKITLEKGGVVNNLGGTISSIEQDGKSIVVPKLQGSGTESDPYLIDNANHLFWFADMVNKGNESLCAKLLKDIELNPGYTFNAEGVEKDDGSPRKWIPIGNSTNNFTGIFDGNGNTVSGIYIDSNLSNQGFFGYINQGTVKNLTVDGYIKGTNSIGGLCGKSEGANINGCTNRGFIFGTMNYVGGIDGESSSNLTNCSNSGKVQGQNNVGGIVGSLSNGITDCFNTGEISGVNSVGGVLGCNSSGNSKNCYNTGSVSGTGYYIGGVCGENKTLSLKNCYYLTDCVYDGSSVKQKGIGNSEQGQNTEDEVKSTAGKTLRDFSSGEITWLLNGSWQENTFIPGKTDGTQVWYQNLATEGGNVSPVLKGTENRTVYYGYTLDSLAEKKYTNDSNASDEVFQITATAKDTKGTTKVFLLEGAGTYLSGQQISLKAPIVSGYNFIGWFKADTENSKGYQETLLCKNRDYSVTLTEKVDYVAVYEELEKVSVVIDGGTEFSINGETFSSKKTVDYQLGSEVELDISNKANFLYWKNENNIILSRNPAYSFTVTSKETISAIFAPPEDNNKATLIYETSYGQELLRKQLTKEEVDSLEIPGGPGRYGYTFLGWTLNKDDIKKQFQPGNVICVFPKYQLIENLYQITVQNGTGTGNFKTNAVVTAVADIPAEGYVFSHWADAEGNILSYNKTYQFYAAKDITITAIEVAEEAAVKAECTAEFVDIVRNVENSRLSFVSVLTVPEGYTMEKAGVIITKNSTVATGDNKENTFVKDAEGTYIFGDAFSGNTYRYTMLIKSTATWYARAYLAYKDVNGNIFILYGDIAAASVSD